MTNAEKMVGFDIEDIRRARADEHRYDLDTAHELTKVQQRGDTWCVSYPSPADRHRTSVLTFESEAEARAARRMAVEFLFLEQVYLTPDCGLRRLIGWSTVADAAEAAE
jgi:methionine synthase II (cobalamin-independent)